MQKPLAQIFSLLGTPQPSLLSLLRGPYSQTELAEIIETDPARINDWEQGRTSPQPRFARALLIHAKSWTAHFGIRLVDLLEMDTEPRKEG